LAIILKCLSVVLISATKFDEVISLTKTE